MKFDKVREQLHKLAFIFSDRRQSYITATFTMYGNYAAENINTEHTASRDQFMSRMKEAIIFMQNLMAIHDLDTYEHKWVAGELKIAIKLCSEVIYFLLTGKYPEQQNENTSKNNTK